MVDYTIRLFGHFIMGIVQGLTEVFPVSSSAHLAMTREILQESLGFRDFPFEAAVLLHLGTLFAILWFYQKDVVELWHSFVGSLVHRFVWLLTREKSALSEPPDGRTGYLMIVSVLTTGIVALVLRSHAERLFGQPFRISGFWILNGIVILFVGLLSSGNKRLEETGTLDYLIIGVAQGLAVLPGISRLGMTLCAGLMRGMDWFDALKLSFLLSLPFILAAGSIEVIGYLALGIDWLDILGNVVGIVAAAFAGYVAIRVLLRQGLHARRRLVYFGGYCILVGSFSALYIAFLA